MCDYKTDRLDNLSRHLNLKHGNWKVISSLVIDLVEQMCESVAERQSPAINQLVEEQPVDIELENPAVHVMVQAGDGSADLEEESVLENVVEVLAINQLSDFELARNKRIAEMHAEFYKQYPELNVDERRKKRSSMI